MPTKPTVDIICDPPSSACRGHRHPVPLLALAPPALALGEEMLGKGDEETNVRDFWNVISKASEIVKDGERLENLAWRQWCQHRRDSSHSSTSHSSSANRRVSLSSCGTTASSASLATPHLEQPPSPTASVSSRHSDRRTFGSALKLLMEEDNFKDWVSDAQKNMPPPTISVPDTPVANLEIRLVEPTPVPSRVGSLGGSMGGAGMMGAGGLLGVAVPPRLSEEPEVVEVVQEESEEEDEDEAAENEYSKPIRGGRGKAGASRSPRKRGKFFVHSSPSKGSGSDTAASPGLPQQSPTLPTPSAVPPSPSPSLSPGPAHTANGHHRRSSGSSSGAAGPSAVPTKKRSPGAKRHVSLSTMRGRFGAEKRKAAEELARKAQEEADAAAAQEEDSGWEDEVEDDGQEETEGDEEEDEDEEVEAKLETVQEGISEKSKEGTPDSQGGSEDWSDEASEQEDQPTPAPQPNPKPARPANMRRTSSNRSAKSNANNRSTSALDLVALLSNTTSRRTSTSDGPPPPPAPTPLRNMSRRQRLAAAEERRRIEAELEAQKKREMFAKQQIFGAKPTQGEGLLSGIFKKGGSMVDLTSAAIPQMMSPPLRPSPTHIHIPALAKSPIGPSLLRSKSAVAVPVQTGVSVTRTSPKRSKLNEEIGSAGSGGSRESQRNMGRATSRTSDRSDKTGSNERRPPEGIILESDDSSSEDDDYLATSSTQRKLAELAAKRDKKSKKQNTDDNLGEIAGPAMPVPTVQQIMQNGQTAVRFDVPAVMQQPMTPTTRRRTIISREMSESLRRNLILERQKSSGGGPRRTSVGPVTHTRPPPITHMSQLSARNSSANLAQYQMGAPLARHRSETALNQQHAESQSGSPRSGQHQYDQGGSSSPQPPPPHRSATTGSVITMETRHRPHPSHDQTRQNHGQMLPPPVPPADALRRKAQPNVLGGFLRPLTRVGTGEQAIINRTQSSANLSSARHESGPGRSISPAVIEAPAMIRRSTEGSPVAEWKVEVDRRREIARRNAGMDTSYRMHGW